MGSLDKKLVQIDGWIILVEYRNILGRGEKLMSVQRLDVLKLHYCFGYNKSWEYP